MDLILEVKVEQILSIHFQRVPRHILKTAEFSLKKNLEGNEQAHKDYSIHCVSLLVIIKLNSPLIIEEMFPM